jgi:hypothetical protein
MTEVVDSIELLRRASLPGFGHEPLMGLINLEHLVKSIVLFVDSNADILD